MPPGSNYLRPTTCMHWNHGRVDKNGRSDLKQGTLRLPSLAWMLSATHTQFKLHDRRIKLKGEWSSTSHLLLVVEQKGWWKSLRNLLFFLRAII